MSEHLTEGLERFRSGTFPRLEERYRRLVEEGQSPSTLFIGCADSRVLPDVITDTGPGELFVVRNVGAFVPPFEPGGAYHATAAGIEYAVIHLGVTDIVVCGHSHCGAVRALYDEPGTETPHITRWLELGREARIDDPSSPADPGEETLRRAEQRSIAIQVGRLMSYPFVKKRVEEGTLSLHGWHYIIEEGQVLILDIDREEFGPAGE